MGRNESGAYWGWDVMCVGVGHTGSGAYWEWSVLGVGRTGSGAYCEWGVLSVGRTASGTYRVGCPRQSLGCTRSLCHSPYSGWRLSINRAQLVVIL